MKTVVQSRSPRSGRGFTLIVVISLLVLLTILGVGMLSLSTIALRASGQGAVQATARANARLAMLLALGDLQRYLGPDARISARAVTMAKHPQVGATVSPGTPQAWWLGAAHGDGNSKLGTGNESVVWLVSGLPRSAGAAGQVKAASFPEEGVTLFDTQSLNLQKYTGGQPIEAGRVPLENSDGKTAGACAWFVDDDGMKAQLAASNPEVRNDRQGDPLASGVLPGSYDIGILNRMDSLEGTPTTQYQRLNSINDLPFLGSERSIAARKRFDYTTESRGILANARDGGLKHDLTIAFENESLFRRAFPSNNPDQYIVAEPDRIRSESSLRRNGYIHFEVFKDYYNLKKYIRRSGSNEYLDPVAFNKEGLYNNTTDKFYTGQLGPHDMGGRSVPGTHTGHPYGNYTVLSSGKSAEQYKHSPIGPILSRLQQNAWVELGGTSLFTHVQLWTSHYNPYNISMKVLGDAANAGPRVINYPQVSFSVSGYISDEHGLSEKRQSHCPYQVMLGPGRSHVLGFKRDGVRGEENDRGLYSDRVKDLTLESVFNEHKLSRRPSGNVTLRVQFVEDRPSLLHGADHLNGSNEVSQVIFAPLAWDKVVDRGQEWPGKSFTKTMSVNELGENAMVSLQLALRTTREASNALRPLVDANVRAMWNNPRWDSSLGLDTLASYSTDGTGEAPEQFMQLMHGESDQGYTYWGSGRGAGDGYDRVILFDIPREDLVSLGQLQHAAAGRFSYEPSYIVGNSYANPRIGTGDWKARVTDTFSTRQPGLRRWPIAGGFNLYDASFLVNERLWDSYIFTTIPQIRDNHIAGEPTINYEKIRLGEQLLPNPRFIPYEPAGSKFDAGTLKNLGRGGGTTGSFYHNAGHLLVDGAFNIHSTSVDAWEAFLSGTHKLPTQQVNDSGRITGFAGPTKGVRFPRITASLGEGMETNSLDDNYWVGFRDLEQDEVRNLAEEIVDQIIERGPFFGLGEFVNRKLENNEHGESGALQAALDATVNLGLDTEYAENVTRSDLPGSQSQGAGFPGQLLQGDILQALSPYMQARSDTFTIRAYGEAINPASGRIEARAWCEACIQRMPDPVPDSGATKSVLEELSLPSSRFGRTMRIKSFRWLSPEEI